MLLRPRQQVFVDRARAALDEHGNTLGVAPTGAGKTVCLAACVDKDERVLVVQHRDELLDQNRDIFGRYHRGANIGVINADTKQFNRPASFAMVQTLSRQDNLAQLQPVRTLIIDEAHHAAAASWQAIIERVRELDEKTRILGVTATPNRGDKISLRSVFDNCCDQIGLAELIGSGHLVKPRTFVIDVGVQEKLKEVRKLSDDYDMQAVEQIMDKAPINESVVRHWQERAADRLTLVFASTISHACHVADAFKAAGVAAEAIHSELSDYDRMDLLDRFEAGEIRVLVNVMILTEGFDLQPIDCVLLLRPSSYKSTMIQMIGRGLRTVDPERYPGIVKTDCIVIDFGISLLVHGSLEQTVNLEDGKPGSKECPECGAKVPLRVMECPLCGYVFPSEEREPTEPRVRKPLDNYELLEVDLFARSPFRWEDIFDDGSILVAASADHWACAIFYYGNWHALGGSRETGVSHIGVGDRAVCIAAADDYMNRYADKDAAAKSKLWLNLPASPKQLVYLDLSRLQAMGLSRYRASCMLTFQFQERAIQRRLEMTQQKRAA